MLSITLIGSLQISRDGVPIALPTSKKTRALFAYLVLSKSPQRRGHLCEFFWDTPDDPRAALRWSLSKLRTSLNQSDDLILQTDRERVVIDGDLIASDVEKYRQVADWAGRSADQLNTAWAELDDDLLADCELPKLPRYSKWLERQRQNIAAIRAEIARQATHQASFSNADKMAWADRWRANAPNSIEAHHAAISFRRAMGLDSQADQLAEEVRTDLALPEDQSFRDVGPQATGNDQSIGLDSAPAQKVHFVTGRDGISLAWASIGDAALPPLVKAANWLTHLELDWGAPIWSPLYRNLAAHFNLVRYDERGCGLSDWEVPEISFETFVEDLETVADAAGLNKFPLLGISQGAAVSIEFAARHPDRVSHLILFGGYAMGWRHTASPEEAEEREAIMTLTKSGWGRSDAVYRRLFSHTFLPDATVEELDWFDEFQRRTTSSQNAVAFLESFSQINVTRRLADLNIPTLILHSRGDRRIPVSTARELAAQIPSAEFVTLESNNHLLIGREPASLQFVEAVREFIHRPR